MYRAGPPAYSPQVFSTDHEPKFKAEESTCPQDACTFAFTTWPMETSAMRRINYTRLSTWAIGEGSTASQGLSAPFIICRKDSASLQKGTGAHPFPDVSEVMH